MPHWIFFFKINQKNIQISWLTKQGYTAEEIDTVIASEIIQEEAKETAKESTKENEEETGRDF